MNLINSDMHRKPLYITYQIQRLVQHDTNRIKVRIEEYPLNLFKFHSTLEVLRTSTE